MKIVSIASARPNFVKLAAIHHATKGHTDHVIIHTGQHYDPLFSDIFFSQLDIPLPEVNLGIAGGTRDELLTKTEAELVKSLPDLKPDIVVVYGDVNGALAGALAAKKLGIKLAHVEAGLRSFDDTMPEEHNRIEIDRLADFLFVTEKAGLENLQKEKVSGKTFLVGNTMIDTLVRMKKLIDTAEIPKIPEDNFAIVTIHRPSNVDTKDMLEKNIAFLQKVSAHVHVVLPLHHRMKAGLEKFSLMHSLPKNMTLLPALGYLPFLKLVQNSQFIITDSGGIQEEAVYLQKRCFTLRRNTERPVTMESGSNVLIDPSKSSDIEKVLLFAKLPQELSITIPKEWDGRAGERIVEILTK